MIVFIFIPDTTLVLISLAGIWCSSDSVSFASKSLCYFSVDTLYQRRASDVPRAQGEVILKIIAPGSERRALSVRRAPRCALCALFSAPQEACLLFKSIDKRAESSNHVQINGHDSLYTNQQRSQDTDDEFHEQYVGPQGLKVFFRKIVVSFPVMAALSSTKKKTVMAALSSTKKKDMVDVNFKCSNTNTSQLQQQLGGSAC
ncbi:hypothetical protein OROMI_003583 [Orobanche minor]